MSNIYKSMCETCLKYAGYHSPFDDNDAVLREDAFRFVLKPHIAPNPAEHHIATRARNGTMHRKAPDVTKRRRCNGQTEEQRGGATKAFWNHHKEGFGVINHAKVCRCFA